MPKIEPGNSEEIKQEDLDQLSDMEMDEEQSLKPKKKRVSHPLVEYINDPILYEIKPLLEQLVQKQNFWTKGHNVRNDGPRMWDLLQRIAKQLNQPIPDHVQQKVKMLQGWA